MADFRQLAIDLIVADGDVTADEIKLLKKVVYEDKKVSHDELQFLIDLRAAFFRKNKEATTPDFDKFFLKAAHDSIVDNEIISAEETEILKKISGDKKISAADMKKFFDGLKKAATKGATPEFDKLHASVVKKAGGTPAPAAPAAAAKPKPAAKGAKATKKTEEEE